MGRRLLLPAALCCSLLGAPAAQAGLFDDSEARQQISDLKHQLDQKLDTQSRAQLELATQIMGLKEEIARLRGQIETLTYENEQAKKRQQDLYLDLDGRLRKLEPMPSGMPMDKPATQTDGGMAPVPGPRAGDPVAESKIYESALNLFKGAKYKEAAAAFGGFVEQHPDSDLAPSAQFWLGNAWYAQQDCKKAIDAQFVVTNRWPNSPKAPDAMLAIANCQRDWGNIQAAKRTLENVVEKYPDSNAANSARQRLGRTR